MSIRPWHERFPELFKRERRLLEELGFGLVEDALARGQVRFKGVSLSDPGRTIEIVYPDAYPSFAPTVLSPVGQVPPLCRHHDPATGVLCTFGFANERWTAASTALEVIREVEGLVNGYSPGGRVPNDDLVPEPVIRHFSYKDGSSILVPPPFAKGTCNEIRGYEDARLLVARTRDGFRGVVTHMRGPASDERAEGSYVSWFASTRGTIRRNAQVRVLPIPPPTGLKSVQIRPWLWEHGIKVPPDKDNWVLFAFDDEGVSRTETRPSWLAMHSNQKQSEWVRCYPVTADDATTRTPFGQELSDMCAVVIGCGSLGSFTAVALAQEGFGALGLVDNDLYEPGNAVRHQVGVQWHGVPKAEALASRIREVAPRCTLQVFNMSVAHLGSHAPELMSVFTKADVIVDTTGYHAVTHYLNRLCVEHHKPLIVGSVTNGVWAAEIFRYRPDKSGCWLCFLRQYGESNPPGAPRPALQFAPGCNQPTFVGGQADVAVASGLLARTVTETALHRDSAWDYVVMVNRSSADTWEPQIMTKPVARSAECDCNV